MKSVIESTRNCPDRFTSKCAMTTMAFVMKKFSDRERYTHEHLYPLMAEALPNNLVRQGV